MSLSVAFDQCASRRGARSMTQDDTATMAAAIARETLEHYRSLSALARGAYAMGRLPPNHVPDHCSARHGPLGLAASTRVHSVCACSLDL